MLTVSNTSLVALLGIATAWSLLYGDRRVQHDLEFSLLPGPREDVARSLAHRKQKLNTNTKYEYYVLVLNISTK